MKQLSFLDRTDDSTNTTVTQWHLYVDGASRNNPGPAGAGACLYKDGKVAFKKGHFLGKKTNNQAEYMALLMGLYYAQQKLPAGSPLSIFADSELLVRQMNGVYKVRSPELKPLQHMAYAMLNHFDYVIQHVFRAGNEQADALANEGIDKKIKLPQPFITLLIKHGITL